jgi:disulfide bond formation protein DsbB
MCWWQRYPHIAAIGLALAAFARPASSAQARGLTIAAAVAMAVSGAIGVYHAGVELGIFEGLTTCSSVAAGASAEDLLKSILNAPLVRCDQVQWSFLGVSMAGWNAILSLGGAGLIAFLLRRERAA